MRMDLAVPEEIGMHYGPTAVEIDRFFLSYNSVLTLAYTHFSQTLLMIKKHVETAMHGNLNPENMGTSGLKLPLAVLSKTPVQLRLKCTF